MGCLIVFAQALALGEQAILILRLNSARLPLGRILMSSETEAYARFDHWKSNRTILKVTVIEGGSKPDILFGRVFGTDPDASLVGIVLGIHQYQNFDIAGAVFEIETTRLTATKNKADWIVFEEVTN